MTTKSITLPTDKSGFMAWVLIVLFVGVTAALIAVRAGSMLNLAFTPMAIMVGIILYLLYPTHFLGFAMWLWMLTPLVRRLADWQSEYHIISPIIVAPVVVTAITAISVWRAIPRLRLRTFKPYFLILVPILWAYVIGVLNVGFSAATYALMNWCAPLFFAVHILNDPHSREKNAQIIFSALAWGTLVMGVYGVLQYFQPQIWDRIWMAVSRLTSIGAPLPQQVRVFSTMNSPATFGMFMMGGELALLAARTKIRWVAAAPGFAAFMLSLVRSAWGGFILGTFFIFVLSPMRDKIRYVISACVLVAVALPLLMNGPIAKTVQARLDTIVNTETDSSFRAREMIYDSVRNFSTVVGVGLGTTGLSSRLTSSSGTLGDYGTFDSGILNAYFTFGILMPVVLGIVGFMFIPAIAGARRNSYAMVSAAIAFGTVAQLVFTDTLSGAPGMLVFPFLAIAAVHAQESAPTRMATRRHAFPRFGSRKIRNPG